MSLFRRSKPLHERLAEDGGLQPPDGPIDTGPWWGEVGIHGVARPREWDAVTTADVDLSGERIEFVTLPDGTVVIDDGPDNVAPLAEAVEKSLDPPYRAEAVRRPDGTWAVGARRIRVLELPDTEGDDVSLTVNEEGSSLVVDGARVFGSARELEALLSGGHGVVNATRIDGSAFEVTVHPL